MLFKHFWAQYLCEVITVNNNKNNPQNNKNKANNKNQNNPTNAKENPTMKNENNQNNK